MLESSMLIEVVALVVHEEVVAPVGQVQRWRAGRRARRGWRAGSNWRAASTIAGEISTTSMPLPRIRGERAERRAGAEADHQRALEALNEERGVVGEEALGVHLPARVALELAVRVERVARPRRRASRW